MFALSCKHTIFLCIGDMISLYQITRHNSDSSLLDLFQPALTTSTRGHNFKYLKPRCNFFFFFFFHIRPNLDVNLDVIHATDPTSSLTELSIIGTIYPHILSMLIQSTLLKIF